MGLKSYKNEIFFYSINIYLDNPNLTDIVHEIEDEAEIGFFSASEFEEALMSFFEEL